MAENIIRIYQFRKIDEVSAKLKIHHRDYKRLSEICENKGNKVFIQKKHGFIWKIYAIASRPIILFILFFFLVLLLPHSGHSNFSVLSLLLGLSMKTHTSIAWKYVKPTMEWNKWRSPSLWEIGNISQVIIINIHFFFQTYKSWKFWNIFS